MIFISLILWTYSGHKKLKNGHQQNFCVKMNPMFIRPAFISILAVFTSLGTPHPAHAADPTGVEFEQSGVVKTVLQKSGQDRSEGNFVVYKTNKGQIPYRLTLYGKGDFDRFEKVSWHIESELTPDGRYLVPLSTVCKIRDNQKQTLKVCKKTYDYFNKIIKVEETRPEASEKNEYTFPIKGRTCDYATLPFFLKTFIPRLGQEGFRHFYLITSEPALYKVNIKFVSEEYLTINNERIPAVRVRLIADMGILDDVFDRFVPPTFMWYENRPPYRWLQYQGMETGKDSPYVRTRLLE